MKKHNELRSAIELAFTNVISIVQNYGEITGVYEFDKKTGVPVYFKVLPVEKLKTANQIAKTLHGFYSIEFFKNEQVMVKLMSDHGMYFIPANRGIFKTCRN